MNILMQFHYDFFVNAIFAALFASISCGIVGTYIVSKRKVFISDGITHASFGGIGIGYYLGLNPIIGAVIFGILSAFGIEFISKSRDVREDSAVGIIWSFGMAVGIIFIFITPGYAPNLMSFLFGNILTVTRFEILLMMILSLFIVLFFSILFKLILFISFDEEYAMTHNAPVKSINYMLLILISLCIVLNIRVVGIILVLSFLTIPQTTANLFSKNFKTIMIFSIIIGFAGSFTGLIFSYLYNIPSGASIIFCFSVIFIIAKMLKIIASKNKIRKAIQ